MEINRATMGAHIAARLGSRAGELAEIWQHTAPLRHFYIDDVLPQDWVHAVRNAFPAPETMSLKKSMREFKYIAAQMEKYNPLLEEAVYAFQQPDVLKKIEAV